MVFFVSVAADIYGRKHNVRLEFLTTPTISELIAAAEREYDLTARTTRPAGYPDVPFRIQTFQVYDDVLMRWVDLYSSAQLTSGCQVYSFQPETVWTVDVQGTIPVARSTVPFSYAVGSPSRARIAAEIGAPALLSEKLRSVFYDLDSGAKGYILYSDLRGAFIRSGLDFSYASVGELFNIADTNRDGSISYEEWVRFAVNHPSIVDALFYKSRNLLVDRPYYTSSAAIEAELVSQRRLREIELERLYRDQQVALDRARIQREYDDARRSAEAARLAAAAAAESERRALDRIYYTPYSPRVRY